MKKFRGVAQLEECTIRVREAVGSSPTTPTRQADVTAGGSQFFFLLIILYSKDQFDNLLISKEIKQW